MTWTKTYLLGLSSEIGDVLKSLAWKAHRKKETTEPSRDNLAFEFADLLKYVMSLSELWGLDSDELISFANRKSALLERISYEDSREIPNGSTVLMVDLDGTVGDWRSSFRSFLENLGLDLGEDSERSLDIEMELNLSYSEYIDLKDKFESTGGYANLYAYPDAVDFLIEAKSRGFKIVVFTARPVDKHRRIWSDTLDWLYSNGISADQVRFGSETRIVYAKELSWNNRVFVLEDNPQLMLRAANAGLTVIGRRHQYNSGIDHPGIRMVDSFEEINLEDL